MHPVLAGIVFGGLALALIAVGYYLDSHHAKQLTVDEGAEFLAKLREEEVA